MRGHAIHRGTAAVTLHAHIHHGSLRQKVGVQGGPCVRVRHCFGLAQDCQLIVVVPPYGIGRRQVGLGLQMRIAVVTGRVVPRENLARVRDVSPRVYPKRVVRGRVVATSVVDAHRIDLRFRVGAVAVAHRHARLGTVGTRLNSRGVGVGHRERDRIQRVVRAVRREGHGNTLARAHRAAARQSHLRGRVHRQVDAVRYHHAAARVQHRHLVPAVPRAAGDEQPLLRARLRRPVGILPRVGEDVVLLQRVQPDGGALAGGRLPQAAVEPHLLHVRQRGGDDVHVIVRTAGILHLAGEHGAVVHGNIPEHTRIADAEHGTLLVLLAI